MPTNGIEQRNRPAFGTAAGHLQGEVCVAVVPPEQGRPQVIALFEVGGRLPDARILVQRLDEQLISQRVARNQ